MERIYGTTRGDGLHAAGAVDRVRVGVRAAARLLAHPVRGGARRLLLPRLRPAPSRRSTSRTSRCSCIGVIAIVVQHVLARHGDRRADHDADPGAVHRAGRRASCCCAGRSPTCRGRTGCGCIRCPAWSRCGLDLRASRTTDLLVILFGLGHAGARRRGVLRLVVARRPLAVRGAAGERPERFATAPAETENETAPESNPMRTIVLRSNLATCRRYPRMRQARRGRAWPSCACAGRRLRHRLPRVARPAAVLHVPAHPRARARRRGRRDRRRASRAFAPGDRCAVEPYSELRRVLGLPPRPRQLLRATAGARRARRRRHARVAARAGAEAASRRAVLDVDTLALVETLGIGAHAVRRASLAARSRRPRHRRRPDRALGGGLRERGGADVAVMDVNLGRLAFCCPQLGVTRTLQPAGDRDGARCARRVRRSAARRVRCDRPRGVDGAGVRARRAGRHAACSSAWCRAT